LARNAEIAEFNVSTSVDQNIGRFDVTVDYFQVLFQVV